MVENLETKLEKTLNKRGTLIRHGLLYFLVGFALIVAYYCVNHVPVLQAGFSKVNDILMPFYLGFVMAYLLCPIYNGTVRGVYRMNRRRFAKPSNNLRLAKIMATVVSLITVVVAIAGLFMLIIPDLWSSITGVIAMVPGVIADAQAWIDLNIDQNPQLADLLQDRLSNISQTLMGWTQQYLLPGAEVIFSGLMTTIGTVGDFFVALIISVYLLNGKETFAAHAKKVVLAKFQPETADKIFAFGVKCNETFGGFINGKIIDSIIIGILCFILMTVLNLPMTMLISVVIGVTNVIPFFGPFIGAIPSILLLLIVDPIAAVKFGILVLALQQLDGNVIGPKILGKATKLASFWVMFAIILGGGLFGFVGMILGVPVFALIYFYATQSVNHNLEERNLPTDTLIYEDFSKYGVSKEEIFGEERVNKGKKHRKNPEGAEGETSGD